MGPEEAKAGQLGLVRTPSLAFLSTISDVEEIYSESWKHTIRVCCIDSASFLIELTDNQAFNCIIYLTL